MTLERSELAAVDGPVSRAHEFPEIPLLSQTEVLFERDGGLTECFVPADLIDFEEVPVKEEWAESIAKQMEQVAAKKGGTGQKTPVRLGWIEGENKFRIIDGFHRDAALRLNGEDTIYATVERTDWDTLYDDRIFTAKDHAHVRFSRVVKWIQEVWEYSGLSDKLTVEQAILLYRYENKGLRLGITEDEAERAKAWVAHKEQQWDTKAMTIHGYLKSADRVDPLLVNATRDKKSGNSLVAPTQQMIKIFSETLGGEFELQNLIWQAARTHNPTGPQIKALCLKVQGKDPEEAQEILDSINIDDVEPVYGKTKSGQLRGASDPRRKGSAALRAAETEIDRVMERVKISLDRSEPVDPDMFENLKEFLRTAGHIQRKLGELAVKVTELKKKGTDVYERSERNRTEATKSSVERSYRRHLVETETNEERTPQERLTRWTFVELPHFGRFTAEDWGTLEPYQQFAAILDHQDLERGTFPDVLSFCKAAMTIGNITLDEAKPQTDSEYKRLMRTMLPLLTSLAPEAIGPIIVHDKANNKLKLTEKGLNYIKAVSKNAKLSVDDSRSADEELGEREG